jgi:hypothetical protein
VRVVEGPLEELDQVGVLGAALDGERSLARGRQHLQRVEHLGRLVDTAEPGQAGAGQHDGVVLPGGQLADARVDVATDAHHGDAQAESFELGCTPG